MLTRKQAPPGGSGGPATGRQVVGSASRAERPTVPLGSVAAGLLSGAAVGFLTATARRRGAPSPDDYRAPHPSAYPLGGPAIDVRGMDRSDPQGSPAGTPRSSAVAGS